jgi:hypothetical protein
MGGLFLPLRQQQAAQRSQIVQYPAGGGDVESYPTGMFTWDSIRAEKRKSNRW